MQYINYSHLVDEKQVQKLFCAGTRYDSDRMDYHRNHIITFFLYSTAFAVSIDGIDTHCLRTFSLKNKKLNMSKYEKLWKHLQSNGTDVQNLTFDEIKNILGFEIDHSFLTYKKETLAFGYQVGKISLKNKHITFQKIKKT